MVSCKVVPPVDSVQLVNITLISLWFMVLITIVFMGFINQLIAGGHHLVAGMKTIGIQRKPEENHTMCAPVYDNVQLVNITLISRLGLW